MYPMIWWWVAGAVITTIAAAIATDDSSSSSSSSDDYERRRREENDRAKREAQEQARLQEEARVRARTAQQLADAKNSAVAFLREHYRKHEKLSVFLNSINQPDSVYSVKQNFSEIVAKYPCDEIATMTKNIEEQKIKRTLLDTALADLNKLKGGY
jgi:hypothetical protein